MNKVFRKEVVIGLIMIIALVVLVFGINYLKGVNVFKAANYYYVSYTNVDGLAISAPVTVNGFKMGQVRSIEYDFDDPGHVLVEISVDKKLRLPKGTTATLGSDLLGTASIVLVMGDSKEMYEVGSRIPGKLESGLLDAVGSTLMPSVEAIVPKVDTLLQNLNNLTSDPALATSIGRLDAITRNLEITTRGIAALTGKLPPITDDVKNITGNFATTSSELAALAADLRGLPVDSLFDNLAAISANLRDLSEALSDPNSTIGLLTSDPELYRNLNTTISSLDSLFVDIKRNPKRYISIKLL